MAIDRTSNLEPTCWDCGAPNDRGSSECWLCQRRDWSRYPGRRREWARPRRGPAATIWGFILSITSLLAILTIIAVSPPIGLVLLVSALPALFVSEFLAYRRRRRGVEMGGWERFGCFLALTIVIPILLVILSMVVIAIWMALQ